MLLVGDETLVICDMSSDQLTNLRMLMQLKACIQMN